ncbi:MAG: YerC/YecD family TrpR-related protein [Candidatus Moranbacteria bacterium]|nr:YerC/YecD family TrpR-related protein [Candidatus Moranbacteria bacterium]
MNWKNNENQRFIQAILALNTEMEARKFLRDLMTKNEIIEFAKRLQIAELLMKKIPYSKIEEAGFSSTTIARVSQWLANGEGGYKIIINKLHHQDSDRLGKGLS